MSLLGSREARLDADTLSMDVVAKDGTLLRLAVARTAAGHVELDNLLEIHEHKYGRVEPLVTYTVRGFLSAADDRGQLTLHMGTPGLTIEQHWMTVAGDWLQMLAEAPTRDAPDEAVTH
ncbi:hypothetical protein [Streptomyces cucumeris]|uniref:hypothetical protein n=1 Tax=Streptomyces cucumeris TaxID=2962890 RepID=UPI0020C840F1|nr:hypothetical protein [Streptomyces sp. NEAU-Y11]MCP9209593.1 hypothetical protein [Streptomyces sp. NEAU-Y11]